VSVLEPGALFRGRYRVVRPLKYGAMGAVYEVLDVSSNARRALKVMQGSGLDAAEQVARFEQEARVTGAIDSEHVVRVLDADTSGSPAFIVMELLEGEELDAVLERRGRLAEAEAILYLTQIADALDRTHAANVVHRDLKPANVFVSKRSDGSPMLKLFDFGIAKVTSTPGARHTRVLGTPLYMAPEQVRGDGDIGPAADLYALAHVAYAMLAGEAYWQEEHDAADSVMPLFMKILGGAKETARARIRRRRGVELPEAFDAWWSRATASDPRARFLAAKPEIDELAAIVRSGAGVDAPPAQAGEWRAPGQKTIDRRRAFEEEATSDVAGAVATGPTQFAVVPNPPVSPVAAQQTLASQAAAGQTMLGAPPSAAHAAPPTAVSPRLVVPVDPRRAALHPATNKRTLAIIGVLAGLLVLCAGIATVLAVKLYSPEPEKTARAKHRSERDARESKKPRPDCRGIKCVPLEVDDPSSVKWPFLVKTTRKLAVEHDPRARLNVAVGISDNESGIVDLTRGSFDAIFYTPDASLTVRVSEDALELDETRFAMPPGPGLPDPGCDLSSVWKEVERAGGGDTGMINYQEDAMKHVPIYNVLGDKAQIEIDAATCKVLFATQR
jgi:serine/threonine protein kinase